MKKSDVFHDWMVSFLKKRLERDYNDIKANIGEKQYPFKGHYPDLILATHGVTVAIMEVETEETITSKQAKRWKELASLGTKLILMIPKHTKSKVADLLWKQQLIGNVSIATYEVVINM